jgi:hypothetical protein
MKKTLFFLISLTLLAGLGSGCRQAQALGLFKTPPTKAVTILYDVTDPMVSRPDPADVSKLFAISTADMYDGFSLRIRRITDVYLSPVYDTSIAPQNSLFGDDMRRIAAVKGFRKQASGFVESLSSEKVSDKDHSVIYRTIAEELNHLADMKADSKQCVIYSDLTEFSEDGDFYLPSTRALLKKDPQAISRQLQKIVPLHDLTGITVTIVYRPTYADEQRFNDIYPMYKLMLEAKGATVNAEANLITQ